jgi:hypothetical protein
MKSILLPYTDDATYRIALLDLFDFHEYTDNLSQCILDLQPTSLRTILQHLEDTCPFCTQDTSFLLLFSYDLLPYTHAYLIDPTKESIDILEKKVLDYSI